MAESTLSNQQREERWVYRKFVELSGLLEGLEFNQPLPPGPDIVVADHSPTLGIEITGMRPRDPRELQKEIAEQELATLIQRRYRARGGPPVAVSLYFQQSPYVLRKHEHPKFVEDVVDLILKEIPSEPGEKEVAQYGDIPASLRNIILQIKVTRWPEGHESWVTSPHAGFIPNSAISDIQAEIDRKDSRQYTLNSALSELWLILFIDPQTVSRWTDPSNAAASGTFASKQFSRAFLLFDWMKEYRELTLNPRAYDITN